MGKDFGWLRTWKWAPGSQSSPSVSLKGFWDGKTVVNDWMYTVGVCVREISHTYISVSLSLTHLNVNYRHAGLCAKHPAWSAASMYCPKIPAGTYKMGYEVSHSLTHTFRDPWLNFIYRQHNKFIFTIQRKNKLILSKTQCHWYTIIKLESKIKSKRGGLP